MASLIKIIMDYNSESGASKLRQNMHRKFLKYDRELRASCTNAVGRYDILTSWNHVFFLKIIFSEQDSCEG